MTKCSDCSSVAVVNNCEEVSCLSTNFGKCITYSGSNLYCEKGGIGTVSFIGTAVAPSTTSTTTIVATGGSGTGATFDVVRTAGLTTYVVTLNSVGSGYEVGDVLTLAGSSLGGSSTTNDITVTVVTLSAIISNGDDLDSIISLFNQRLCEIASDSPSGLDYSGFSYSCLRFGGNLESVGDAITTSEEFVESVSSALCSVNTRVKALENPAITVPSCSSLVSGTSTLVQILNEYGSKICALESDLNIETTETCSDKVYYDITTKPANGSSLNTWFDWVIENFCGMSSTIDQYVDVISDQLIDLNTFLFGTSTAFPTGETLVINTSCLTGGVTNSNLSTAVNLLVTRLCALTTTVATVPDYTVDWACMTSPYASNSIFHAQSVSSFDSTTDLQTHLDQIAEAISALNIKFSSDFTITTGTCGPTISLNSGATFTCASLNSCAVDNMSDVQYSSTPVTGQILGRVSGQWKNLYSLFYVETETGSGTQLTPATTSYNATSGNIETVLELPISSSNILVPYSPTPSFNLTVGVGRNCTTYPIVVKLESSGVNGFKASAGFKLTNSSGSSISFTNGGIMECFDLNPLAQGLFEPIECLIGVQQFNSSNVLQSIHFLTLRIDGGTTTAPYFIGLINHTGATITIPNTDYLQVVMGGITWIGK